MNSYKISKHYCRSLRWIGIISLLLSYSGYSNYTSPLNKETTIELVVAKEKKSFHRLSTFFQFKSKETLFYSYGSDANVRYLQTHHGKLIAIKSKNAIFPFLGKRRILQYTHSSLYPSEEAPSFHLES